MREIKVELLQLQALNFLPWAFSLVKKLEIEKTKTTFIISVLKCVYYVTLFFFRTQFSSLGFFINKKSWKSKKLRPPSKQLLKLI